MFWSPGAPTQSVGMLTENDSNGGKHAAQNPQGMTVRGSQRQRGIAVLSWYCMDARRDTHRATGAVDLTVTLSPVGACMPRVITPAQPGGPKVGDFH
jgi:hypothetical protein